ncbi:MAG: patatin-like phospholipase family protein [Pseudomonadota bacterium]
MQRYRILCLDGGGIRGLIAAIWLQQLEQKLNAPLREHFDLVAGTSTGNLLACAVSLGLPAERIVALYFERGSAVFPGTAARLWSRASRIFSEGLSAPRYDGKGLEKALKRVFAKTRFGELAIKPTLVFTYDTFNREPVVFKNTKPEHLELPVWEICKASCSAPTYFPAHVMKLGKARTPLIDGGVAANNPTACAIAEGVRVNKGRPAGERAEIDDFVVASFGTGELTRPIDIAEAREWGALEWAVPIIDVLFDGSTDAVNYIATQILDDDRYFRFQTRLDAAYDDMDNADATNLNALANTARRYLSAEGGDALLDRLAAQLRR